MFERICAFALGACVVAPVAAGSAVAEPSETVEWLRQLRADSPAVFVPREEVPDADRVRSTVENYALDTVAFSREDLALLKTVQRDEQDFDRKIEDELKDSLCTVSTEVETTDIDAIVDAQAVMENQIRSHWMPVSDRLFENLTASGRETLVALAQRLPVDGTMNWRAVAERDAAGFVRFYWRPYCRYLTERPPLLRLRNE